MQITSHNRTTLFYSKWSLIRKNTPQKTSPNLVDFFAREAIWLDKKQKCLLRRKICFLLLLYIFYIKWSEVEVKVLKCVFFSAAWARLTT